MAAVLACGDGAVLSHRSAARLWAILPHQRKPPKAEVTVCGRDPRPPKVRVHRVRRLERDETTTWKRIPITNPARTLLDISAALDPRQVERALAEAHRRRLVRAPAIAALLAHHPRRPGIAVLRRLLESDEPLAWTRSEAEERFLALIREAELPPPQVNARLGPYEVDYLWREHRLAVEVDSWTFHSDRNAFESDRRRDADLAARGFRVIRVTWRQMRDAPVAVVARIASSLASRG
jgi:very-short-patch-repair endonuclease